MKTSPFILGLVIAALLATQFVAPGLAEDTSAAPAASRTALVGKWVLDPEATADAYARAQFGPRQQVTALPAKAGQPRAYQTNFTNKPFNPREYEQFKAAALEGFRANTNAPATAMTFAADGTGTREEQIRPGAAAPGGAFQWDLKGHNLNISNPAKGSTLQLQFTNQTQLCIPGYRGMPLVFRPEKARSK